MIKQTGSNIKTFFMARNLKITSIKHKFCARPNATIDIASNLLQMRRTHHRAHLSPLCITRRNTNRLCLLYDLLNKRIRHRAYSDRHRDRHTTLTCRAISSPNECINGLIKVGIRHHNQMILCAPERLHTLAILVCGLVNNLRYWCRAHKTYRSHSWMSQ